jgi:hypothetical protein
MQVSDALTGSINLPSAGLEVGDFELISQVRLNSGQSSVTFGGIPQTYKNLRIYAVLRTDRAVDNGYIKFNYNGNTTSGAYKGHNLVGNGGGSLTADTWGETNQGMIQAPGVNNANYSTAITMDIVNYTSSSINKTTRILSGYDMNGSGWIASSVNIFFSTDPITTITFADSSGSNLSAYAYFGLYGIRG